MDRPLQKLRARHAISAHEELAIRELAGGERSFAPGEVVVRAGERLKCSTLLLDGILGRTKGLADGRALFTELHVAGDFADLHSFSLKRLDHEVVALSACQVVLAPHDRIEALVEAHPRLG